MHGPGRDFLFDRLHLLRPGRYVTGAWIEVDEGHHRSVFFHAVVGARRVGSTSNVVVATPDPTSPSAERFRQSLASASASGSGADSAAAIRLAQAVRALARVTVGSDAPESALQGAAETIEGLVATLGRHAAKSRYDQATRLSDAGTFVNHPMIGLANPCAPPIVVETRQGNLTGHVTFGTPQEGPPDCAYGGYIAAGFDAALLMTAGINGVGGPTRSLAVRYRRPAPLQVPLHYEGRISRMEERWVVVEGSLMAGDTVCAEATAEVAQVPLRTA